MSNSKAAIIDSLLAAMSSSKRGETPYKHWFAEGCLPEQAIDDILALPFPAPSLGGISGKREVHNKTRRYFDVENQKKFPVCKNFCEAFQDPRITSAIEQTFATRLGGNYLRVEYAQDTDGFWLEPHTDLGVKVFTMLLYLSKDPSHENLGTDIYDSDKNHVGRSPFKPGGAMIFIPSDITMHGFEARPIEGVRKSIIINYVTNDWRAREQLAFPDQPIA